VEVQARDAGRESDAPGVLADDPDHPDADSVLLDDHGGPRVRVVRTLVEDVGAEHGEGDGVHLAGEVLAPVVELVVADGHGVVAHRAHHLHEGLPAGEVGEHAREHVARVEEEDRTLAGADLLHERREVRGSAQPRRAGQPVGGDRVERAVEVVRVEDRDFPRRLVGRGGVGRGQQREDERTEAPHVERILAPQRPSPSSTKDVSFLTRAERFL
jgi:hypothetical protein